MTEVPVLPLPTILPCAEVMKSWGHNHTAYDPEFWEFQYRVHRYLGRLTDDELRMRYDGLLRNIQSIVSA